MTGPADSVQPQAVSADRPPTQTLEKDAIGLGRSTIFAMAGAAPGQTVAITLALLVASSAGVLAMIIARYFGAPIFKARIETAQTTEAVSTFGAG